MARKPAPQQKQSRQGQTREGQTQQGPEEKGQEEKEPSVVSAASPPSPSGVSRRTLLGTAGATGLALGAVGAGAGYALAESGGSGGGSGEPGAAGQPLTSVGRDRAMFHGKHQPGILTPMQARGHLVAFDLAPGAGRKEAAALLRRWSAAAERLMAGEPVTGAGSPDTDVARDAGPSLLTVTFGFGHSFFARTGMERRRPTELDALPEFSSDRLDKRRSDGDLWVQIGANDALVAFHALRILQKEAAGAAKVRWQMNGFNRSPGATAYPMTTRNLMGQIDGTNNPKPTEKDFDRRVFVAAGDGPDWMAGGSYAVVRRIRMLLDDWEGLSLGEQERVIGRRKSDGAPLSGGKETTQPKLEALDKDGELVVPVDAHARISRPDQNGGAAMLRRPFSFHDGFDAKGEPDAGLLFICWQADPVRGFVPVQRKLDRGDALSPFIRHESSALFAVPGGAGKGEYVGQRLFES
ncbi:deferrochelatase/peroxidase EfeB [Streptomyces sp. NA04227]|uniref:iron uptake transporter deferrochelatase/peroxidase subunit n=1 Tax=Streptomyces sp. NA04227 TaxID=2742136 RepID=UPI001591FD6F|nr:iron uptake transporter deferrochelatase/peroxidase subunit [Streptomyces sp. NA04227]QKW07886.1 deferrochelatase/peroxidase EfeB [Streptomyces sp. NA04227]